MFNCTLPISTHVNKAFYLHLLQHANHLTSTSSNAYTWQQKVFHRAKGCHRSDPSEDSLAGSKVLDTVLLSENPYGFRWETGLRDLQRYLPTFQILHKPFCSLVKLKAKQNLPQTALHPG